LKNIFKRTTSIHAVLQLFYDKCVERKCLRIDKLGGGRNDERGYQNGECSLGDEIGV
jgi:hypothetical protein